MGRPGECTGNTYWCLAVDDPAYPTETPPQSSSSVVDTTSSEDYKTTSVYPSQPWFSWGYHHTARRWYIRFGERVFWLTPKRY
jgi:hypothetical protein